MYKVQKRLCVLSICHNSLNSSLSGSVPRLQEPNSVLAGMFPGKKVVGIGGMGISSVMGREVRWFGIVGAT
jgi:hypothetical protein